MVEDDPSSGWRHVDSMEKLMSNAYEACETLGDIWDRSATEFEDSACMGNRQLLKGEEVKKGDKTFLQLTFGRYSFDTFSQVDDNVSVDPKAVCCLKTTSRFRV